MTKIKACLVRPHQRYQDSYIDGVWEYIREKQSVTWHPEILRTRFAEYLQVLQQAETDPLAGMVPSSRYWLSATASATSVMSICGIISMTRCDATAAISAIRFAPQSGAKASAY